MERIASFTVDHNVLVPGLYLSRRDGNVVTFDLRFKKPNTGDLLTNAEMHSVEHIIATLLRNSPQKDAVVYFGPMGCQTGFYFLFDGAQLSESEAVALVQQVFARGAELISAGLDVPQITRIAMELKRRGLDIDPAVYTVDALERQLLALRKGGAGC